MSAADSLGVIAALGYRVVRVPDLGRASLILPRHSIVLVDTEISVAGADDALEVVLGQELTR